MSLWHRIFGVSDVQPAPAAVLERLYGLAAVTGDFGGDEAGWFRADLVLPDGTTLHLECFQAKEEGIRAELNSWAAHLETFEDDAAAARLMEHVIQTRQLYLLERPDDATAADALCVELCRFLAQQTDGVYQIDGLGFFAADGSLLVEE